METRVNLPAQGWIVELVGNEADLKDWERSLKPPSDPWCQRITKQDGSIILALRSCSFDNLQSETDTHLS